MRSEEDSTLPFFSVVVPVRDGGPAFDRCLEALRDALREGDQWIVVDDGSMDDSAARAEAAGAEVLRLPGSLGPAAARNTGAERATGRFLLFVDADCEVHENTLSLAQAYLEEHAEVHALFGSYDDQPAAPGLVSRYKNLFHHWVHHRGRGPADTFWAGCGAVRRDFFDRVGGFDADRFARPSIEDIELGYRLRDAGANIVLLPEMQVKHWKRWQLSSLVRTDLFARAVPWTRLLLERRRTSATDLNLDMGSRVSVAFACSIVPALALSAWDPVWLGVAALALVGVLALNLRLYAFFGRHGPLLALAALPLHLLYLGYSGLGALLGVVAHYRAALGADGE